MTAGALTAPSRTRSPRCGNISSLAPWGLRDLAALAAGILDASGVVPVNAAARALPSERTIRFYVARSLVSQPDGRGTAAVYSYRHLLQVLAIKLRQMEGATLDTMTREFVELHRRSSSSAGWQACSARGSRPDRLSLMQAPGTGRGRVGRAVLGWLAPVRGRGRGGGVPPAGRRPGSGSAHR